MVGGSGFMFRLQIQCLSQSFRMGDVMRQNPDLMSQFASSSKFDGGENWFW